MNPKLLTVACLILIVAAPAMASTFPPEWAGHWEMTEHQRDCNGEDILKTGERSVEISEGSHVTHWDPAFDFPSAPSSIDVTTLEYSGARTDDDGECVTVTTFTCTVTRDGDSVSGVKRVEVVVTDCPGSHCYEDDIIGTRGSAPVESTTWSTVKALYD